MAQTGSGNKAAKRISQLASHVDPFVTVAELAEYWLVSRKQVYKQIKGGLLPALRIGPRLLRIRTRDAFEFERSGNASSAPDGPAILGAAGRLPVKAAHGVAVREPNPNRSTGSRGKRTA